MKLFTSTRGDQAAVSAPEAVLRGIAPDGGLYLPVEIPRIPAGELMDADFCAMAKRILGAYLPGYTQEEIDLCVDRAYAGKFEDKEITPVKEVGGKYVLENADAEVFARTWRRKRICIPETYIFKGDCVKNYKQIWLTVGKRRIKIFGNSSNIVDSCDKMIKKSEWNLPGGLHLPLSLEMEHVRVYDRAIKKMNEETAARILTEKAVEDSKQNMRAGVILDMHHRCQVSDGRYILEADLECHEMIAQTVPAKWMNEDVIHD